MDKTCTKCATAKPLDAFSKQLKGRYGVTSACKVCASQRGKNWHAANREHSCALKAAYRLANAAKMNDKSRQWRADNKARAAAKATAWTKANGDKKAAATARRRAALLRAIPKWADTTQMKHMYRWAKEATAATDVVFEVDHIYPLQSPVVCGLHVWENLIVRTRQSNRSKHNRI